MSKRLSCQRAVNWPESATMSGKNWCPFVCGSIRVGVDQCPPPSVVFTKKIDACEPTPGVTVPKLVPVGVWLPGTEPS